MSIKLWLILGACIVIFGAGGYGTYRWMEAENLKLQVERDNAKQDAINASKRALRLDENLTSEQQLSAKRNTRAINAERDRDNFAGQLTALANSKDGKGNRTEANVWLAATIPVAVRELRRHDAGCPLDLSVPCPNVGPSADTGALDGRLDRTGAYNGGGTLTPSPAVMQQRQGGRFRLDSKGTIQEVGILEVTIPSKLAKLPKEAYESRR